MPVADMNLPALPASPALPALAAAMTGNDAALPEFTLDRPLLLQAGTIVEAETEPVASAPTDPLWLALFTNLMPPPASAAEPDSQALAVPSPATPAPATSITISDAAVVSPALPANADEHETAAEAAPIPSPEFSALAELPLKAEAMPDSAAPPPQAFIERLAPVTAVLASTPPAAALMPQAADFHDRFAERVLWSVRQDEQEARLELHPRDLGRVDIQIRISGSETQIVFAASDSSAREAIHHALPRLAELMSASGLQLTQAQVTAQSFTSSQTPQQAQARVSARRSDSAPDEPAESAVPRPLHRVGLVDHYA